MSSSRIVTVAGATGAQGGAVVRALAETGKYIIRGLTRDANSAKAQAVKKLSDHIEMVTCDINKPDDVRRAFEGSWAVFTVTDFMGQPDKPDAELLQGKAMVDAAVTQKVEYLVCSVLEDADKISGGKLHVPHFSYKSKIRDYIKETYPKLKAIYVEPAYYMQNWTGFSKPTKLPDGTLLFSAPLSAKAKINMADIDDTGPVVRAILEDPEKYVGQDICITGEHASLEDVAQIFTRVTGIPAVAGSITEEQFRSYTPNLPKTIQDEIYDMHQWFELYGYYGPNKDWTTGQKVAKLTSFEDWLKKTGWKG